MNDPHDAADAREAVGSLGEETAKLLGAFATWARDQGADLGTGLGAAAAQAAEGWHGIDEHLATGAAECQYCPICRTIHVVRQTSPEVRAHLAVAAASLMQAAAALMATAVPDEGATRRRDGVEHIDLDEGEAPTAPAESDEEDD